MKILVIKQTSLGDVLHSTASVRAIRQQYPDSHIILLTATSSEQIYRYNDSVNEIILIDRYGIKRNWWKKPIWSCKEMLRVCREVRACEFDLAFDLQGLGKSVLFLYLARSKRKFAKGNWIGLDGFRNKRLHALDEMAEVLKVAGIAEGARQMEFSTSSENKEAVDKLMAETNPNNRPVIIMSPFSRWPSKDWPLDRYLELARNLCEHNLVVFTGAPEKQKIINQALEQADKMPVKNLAGKLSLLEFAELARRASYMVTGDSFPMHVSCATQTPVLALFGPTNEDLVGPQGSQDRVVRVRGCQKCKKRNCPRSCLNRLDVSEVAEVIENHFQHLG